MSTREQMWNAVLANLDDESARLAWADFLQEGDKAEDHDRAELIKIQIALSKCGPPHKIPTYNDDHPTPLDKLGDNHYRFHGYASEGWQIGDRVDMKVHIPLAKPKKAYGLRIYKIVPDPDSGPGEFDIYVRKDEQSKPWEGIELKAQEKELLSKYLHWSLIKCKVCNGWGMTFRSEKPNQRQVPNRICSCCRGACYLTSTVTWRESIHDTYIINRREIQWHAGYIDSVTATLSEVMYAGSALRHIWCRQLLKQVPTVRKVILKDRVPYRQDTDMFGMPEKDRQRYSYFWNCAFSPIQIDDTDPHCYIPITLQAYLRNGTMLSPSNYNHLRFYETIEQANDDLACAVVRWMRDYSAQHPLGSNTQ
jgi:uncharacterized protein (TIGR02996 family)